MQGAEWPVDDAKNLVRKIRTFRERSLDRHARVSPATRRALTIGALTCFLLTGALQARFFASYDDYLIVDHFVLAQFLPPVTVAVLLLGFRPHLISIGIATATLFLAWRVLFTTQYRLEDTYDRYSYDAAAEASVAMLVITLLGVGYCTLELVRPGAAPDALAAFISRVGSSMRHAVGVPVAVGAFLVSLLSRDLWEAMLSVDPVGLRLVVGLAVLISLRMVEVKGIHPHVWQRVIFVVSVVAASYVFFLLTTRVLVSTAVAGDWLGLDLSPANIEILGWNQTSEADRYRDVVSRIAQLFAAVTVISTAGTLSRGHSVAEEPPASPGSQE